MKTRKNIYLAYLRTKNSSYGNSRFDEMEIKYFESTIEVQMDKLCNALSNHPNLDKFRLYQNEKSFKNYRENKDQNNQSIKFEVRPLTRYSFYDEVLIQSVFNIINENLEYHLPKENYGAKISEKDSPYSFKPWYSYYREFKRRLKNNARYESPYQFLFQFDIKNFYPSINRAVLLNRLGNDLGEGSELYIWSEYILKHYDKNNAINIDLGEFQLEGLPQGPDFSRFLSLYFIKDLKRIFIGHYNNQNSSRPLYESEIDFFMYVDDGYIFFKENVEEEKIKLALNSALSEINSSYTNDNEGYGNEYTVATQEENSIKLEINDEKSKFIVMDSANMRDIFLNMDVSMNREAIDVNANITSEEFKIIQEGVDLEGLNNITFGELGANKIEDLIGNQLKRNISTFSRLKLDRDVLYSQMNNYLVFSSDNRSKIRSSFSKQEDIISDKLAEEIADNETKIADRDDNVTPFIDTINFEYVFSNFMNRCVNSTDLSFLFRKVFEEFKRVKDRCLPNHRYLHYYESFILNKLFSIPFDSLGLTENQARDLIYDFTVHNKLKKNSSNLVDYSFGNDIHYFLLFSQDKSWRQLIFPYIKVALNEMDPICIFDNNQEVSKCFETVIEKLNDFEREAIIGIYKNYDINFDFENVFHINHYNLELVRAFDEIKSSRSTITPLDENGTYITAISTNKEVENSVEKTKIFFAGEFTSRSIRRQNDKNIRVEYSNSIRNLGIDSINPESSFKLLKSITKLWREKLQKDEFSPSLLHPDALFYYTNDSRTTSTPVDGSIIESDDVIRIIVMENTDEGFYNLNKRISQNYYQKLFIIFFEKLFSVNINEAFIDDTLEFWQFRIVSGLQCFKFSNDQFISLLERVIEEVDIYSNQLSLDIFKASRIFRYQFLDRNSMKYVDKLLVIHQYYSNVWKNGSKDLFFFTLHNQLHSLTLIENYHKLTMKHSRLTYLNRHERFLLFAACYLHDIGMLVEADVSHKTDLRNRKVKKLYNKHSSNDIFSSIIKPNLMHTLLDIHKDIDSIIEDIVRSEHPKTAGKVIKVSDKLPLSDLERKVIGIVSENHGAIGEMVHGKTHILQYSPKNINVRKISKFLRVLDLSDVGKERVTEEIIGIYGNRMSSTSLSHWIKHLATEGIKVDIKYGKIKDSISKRIEVIITILYNYLPNENKIIKTSVEHDQCYIFDSKTRQVKLDESKKKEDNSQCNLLCAFIREHYWFIEELKLLNSYGNDNNVTYTLIHQGIKDVDRTRKIGTDYNVSELSSFDQILVTEYSK